LACLDTTHKTAEYWKKCGAWIYTQT
jgi:hypothetical protein